MPQQQTFTSVTPIAAPSAPQQQSFSDVMPIGISDEAANFLKSNSGYKWMSADPKFPNRPEGIYPTGRGNEWRNDPSFEQIPVDLHIARHTYEGAKAGAMAATAPMALEATIPQLVGGAVGGTVGTVAGRKIAEKAGAGELGQEVAGDIGGVAGGAAGAGAVNWGAEKAVALYRTLPGPLQRELLGLLSPRAVHALKLVNALKPEVPPPTNPGAPLPATPPAEVLQAQPLAQGGAAPPPEPAAALSQIPLRPTKSLADLSGTSTADAAAPRKFAPLTDLEKQINDALGGKPLKPGVPLRDQLKPSAEAAKLPQGFTPVESSVLKGYKYNAATQEFESITKSGQHYVHGEVTPDQVEAFEDADSKGQAWNQLRQSATPLAKVINGKRVPIKPVRSSASAESAPIESTAPPKPPASTTIDDDLTSILQKSLKRVQAQRANQ